MKQRLILWIVLWASALMVASIVIPGILVKPMGGFLSIITTPQIELIATEDHQLKIPVYLTQEDRIETVPVENYVRNVLAAEMPANFELEALKAQAIAARTYIIRRINSQDFNNVPEGAWVTDTVAHQVFITNEQLKKKWNIFKYAAYMSKINLAVNETEGLIVTYDNNPIDATFFSTSNGYTENSEDYWTNPIPYLRSVPSPWDVAISPRYIAKASFSIKELYTKLGLPAVPTPATDKQSTTSDNLANHASTVETFRILEWTEGKRIKRVSIGNHIFTGREVREKLGLNSSQFIWNWNVDRNEVVFTTYGYGHGVGMSQWGANGMAKEGKKAEEIIKYYYQDVQIERALQLL